MITEDEEVELLRTISGVGLITAATLRAYIDDIHRYESPKKFAAHMGLHRGYRIQMRRFIMGISLNAGQKR